MEWAIHGRGVRGRWVPAPRFVLAGLLALGPGATAQEAPAYQAAGMLSCAGFREVVRTTIRAQRGGSPYHEAAGRIGLVVVRAQGSGPIRFTAWYDTLAIWYDTASQGRLAPETDGLLGGRWEGRLSPTGEATLDVRPFMPPEIVAVSDLSDALLDFLPPLAPVPIAVGRSWTDSLGLVIERLADSSAAPVAIQRYRWTISSRSEPPLPGDSTARLRQVASDEGRLAWQPGSGPLGWGREVVIETEVSGPSVRLPWRGRVTQRITVTRVTEPPRCH